MRFHYAGFSSFCGIEPVDTRLARSHQLKQDLLDFVFDAEGELAATFEAYVAAELTRLQRQDRTQRDLVVDTFLTAGQVGDQTPIDLFLAERTDLTADDRQLLQSWKRSFIGLFAIQEILVDGLHLMNWLTAKHYTVKLNPATALAELERFQIGEILLARIAPLMGEDWIFSGPYTPMGKLSKPKLAVAIGNFKQNYKQALYSDAPELLEKSWQSVERYHQEFLDFFGTDEITLSGYELSKKFTHFQQQLTEKRLADLGIDGDKPLGDNLPIDSDELEVITDALGVDADAVAQVMKNKTANEMVMPKVEFPPELKKAEQVTVLAHPRWGQMFLPTYTTFKNALQVGEASDRDKWVKRYLEDAQINAFVWHRLTEHYSAPLETALQSLLARPDFKLDRDLDQLLQEHGKSLTPELPEIASVPLHLHSLFQEALAEVSKDKAKSKTQKKPVAKGFAAK